MTVPLAILAAFAILTGFLGTPAWPWFHWYLNGETTTFSLSALTDRPELYFMALCSGLVLAALAAAWSVYGSEAAKKSREFDPLEKALPLVFAALQKKLFIDEIYEATVIRLNAAFSLAADWMDRVVWGGLVNLVSFLSLIIARVSRAFDDIGINGGFDIGCGEVRGAGGLLAKIQDGKIQHYLRIIGLAFALLALSLIWGCA